MIQLKTIFSMYLKNIADEDELEKDAVVKKSLTTAKLRKNYNILHYILNFQKKFLGEVEEIDKG